MVKLLTVYGNDKNIPANKYFKEWNLTIPINLFNNIN